LKLKILFDNQRALRGCLFDPLLLNETAMFSIRRLGSRLGI
jgi:hypothetical protein